jgi:hypothetical protein
MTYPPVTGADDGDTGYGVLGTSAMAIGVEGQVGTPSEITRPAPGEAGGATPVQAGVAGYGYNTGIPGRPGLGATHGVYGSSLSGDGVTGNSAEGNGVSGTGAANGVFGTCTTTAGRVNVAGVSGQSNGDGPGVLGTSYGAGPGVLAVARGHQIDLLGVDKFPGLAAFMAGNMFVTGDVSVAGDVLLANADCAEDFDVADPVIDPGTVVIINEAGRVEGCQREYDKRVVGVISGAGPLRPGIVLDKRQTGQLRMPVALFGKVYCKVDASTHAIAAGDALTTSATPGHAMRATDQTQAFGAVIGKALGSLASGIGLVPMLVVLQ